MPGAETNYQSYGLPWANASNTPYRLYKHWVHEGGIASPLVAHWPAGIKRHGELTAVPGHVVDDLAAKHPQRVKKMVALYDAWAARSEVLPWRSWIKKKPKK